MTNTMKGGSTVSSGYYLNLSRWAIQPVAKDGERLPEGEGEWMKVPTAAAILLTPVLGATFLMFLPLIGFALLLQALVTPLIGIFRHGATEVAATMSPGWQPGEAHFTGKSTESAGVEEKGPIARRAARRAREGHRAAAEREVASGASVEPQERQARRTIMARYTGGASVKSGYYWNPRSWAVEVDRGRGADGSRRTARAT